MYVLTYIHMYICTYVHMYVCMYVCMYVHMYIRMYQPHLMKKDTLTFGVGKVEPQSWQVR